MRTVVGAGSIGLALAARLARAGRAVRIVTRSEEQAARLTAGGVQVTDPATGQRWCARVTATAGTRGLAGAAQEEGPVLLCVRSPDSAALADALASAWPEAAVVSVQNGVDNDALLARRFARVAGVVWRQTCTRTAPEAVSFTGPGRVIVGACPGCADPAGAAAAARALHADLAAAGFDATLSADLRGDRWLKLCMNLLSAPNALVRREDHGGPALAELKARLLEEARAALSAAGIEATSCDGRDRSLDEEIAWLRSGQERARTLPLYNSVWRGLSEGAPLEADEYHRRIVALAETHGLAAPVNVRMLAALEQARAAARGPECFSAAALLDPH
jgi:2-dehydropantoate 2-reductase